MKKLVCMITALTLLLTFLAFPASATDNVNEEQAELLTMALMYFPEYNERLSENYHFPARNTRSTESPSIVGTTTRQISESESMTISEYSDGTLLISANQYNVIPNVSCVTPGLVAVNYVANIRATCVAGGEIECSGYFTVNNIQFTLVGQQYDMITNAGTASATYPCTLLAAYTPVMNETASGYAQLRYDLQFRFSNTPTHFLTSTLVFMVGNNNYYISHTGHD